MSFQQEHTVEPLRVSIIIEWENVRLSELGRSKAMLRQLSAQILQLTDMTNGTASSPEQTFLSRFREVEVMVLYDDKEIDGSVIARIIEEVIKSDHLDIQLRLLPAPGRRYYQLKNFGAQRATGNFIVFLDSDVIPEEGWLLHLLAAFANPEVQVVGSNVYIDPSDLYAKAFALGWFFPLRAEDETLHKVHYFFANSVAFRKEVFAKFAFPVLKGTSRGACGKLAQTLTEHGVGIYQNRAARLSHPPPNGLKHFIIRALAEGRDHLLFHKHIGAPDKAKLHKLPKSFEHFRFLTTRAAQSIVKNRACVNLSLACVPGAVWIMSVYYLLYLMGEIMTRVSPSFMEKHFEI